LAGPEYGNATKTYTNATAASIIAASEMLGLAWRRMREHATEVFSNNLDRIFESRGDLEAFAAALPILKSLAAALPMAARL
jgi:glucosamine--fructose-6-phosphate aminotransferase (isomerizing)